MRETLNQILARYSGQPLERIQADIEGDFIMTPGSGQGIWTD
jgi:ATP-dependent protease ClpP protease subunit